ncbi:MAG: aldehyde dehydrogenase family protein [Candidatus Caldarchaeum sp.]
MAELVRRYSLFIDGKEVPSASGKTYLRENPATGKPFAVIAEGEREDIDRAVRAATQAFPAWSRTPPAERARIIRRIAGRLDERRGELATTNTLETGKPIRESLVTEVAGVVRTFEYYAGAASRISGKTVEPTASLMSITVREPVGVVGHIIPWNFPLLLAAWKVAPALAAGCTIVAKPSELTPCGTLEMARIFSEAGLPDGVFNVVPGVGHTAGQALVEHPGVAKIAFTGSTSVGRHIMGIASRDLKRVSLELGGKAPNIVFDDVDIEDCVEANLRGGFFNQGENCTAVTRLLLHERIYDEFLQVYLKRVGEIRVGNPMDERTEMGALVSREHLDNVKRYFEIGVKEGGRVLAGGREPEDPALRGGYFFMPTVMGDVLPTHTLACEEVFGPLVAVMPFRTEEEAIAIANGTIYGLAGGVWSRDIKRALRVAKALRAGYVWVNTYGGIIPEAPYGGLKQSGMGKELGEEGMEAYLETKCINVYLGDRVPKWYGL